MLKILLKRKRKMIAFTSA